MSKPKPAPLPSGTVVGGYQIVKKLAAGGFGVVYLAERADGQYEQAVGIALEARRLDKLEEGVTRAGAEQLREARDDVRLANHELLAGSFGVDVGVGVERVHHQSQTRYEIVLSTELQDQLVLRAVRLARDELDVLSVVARWPAVVEVLEVSRRQHDHDASPAWRFGEVHDGLSRLNSCAHACLII